VVRFSEYYLTTTKEDAPSSDIPSYSLSLRAGLIKKIASGIYAFLPLGYRVLKKIEKIVREEMDRTGAIEMLMPALQPGDLWIQSGRWYKYGPELFRLKDRNERDFCLGPTHEELITHLAYLDIKSYKDMPVNLYQIQVKFRDEIRPRYGILRAREFIMKDAYSFCATENDLDIIYKKMYECYSNILKRLSLKYYAVEADTGLIGGNYSHEFIILAKNGEDEIVYCPSCGYAANYEMAKFIYKKQNHAEELKELLQVHTPSVTNIKSLSDFLNLPADKIIKTMLLKDSSNDLYAILLSGDRELNIPKIEKVAGQALELVENNADNQNLNIGFLGPVGLDSHVKIYADNIIKGRYNLAAGANKKDCHLINVNYPRDFKVDLWGDFSFASEGDLCINCKCLIKFEKGIEIGHIFKLGTKYSEKMGALFLDSEGKLNPIIMGCYGIGVSRILAAVIEQLYDGKGILWPTSIAPFMVNLVAINMEDLNIASNAEKIYQMLLKEGIEAIFDDRNVRAGVKFKDSDLIGIPIKLIVGKNYTENEELEIELRKDGTKIRMGASEALDFIKSYSEKNLF
jgi:prolyl-tRNA synthetase, family II